jgi:hypothetical protein
LLPEGKLRAKTEEFFVKTDEGTLAPTCQEAEEMIKNIKEGNVVPLRVVDDPSPEEFGAVFSFLKFIYNNQDKFNSFNLFREEVKYGIGWGDYAFHETSHGDTISTFRPRSWKWRDISHDEWHTLAQNIFDYIHSQYGVSFDDWKSKRYDYEICATPYCFGKAAVEHHVFPGTGRREVSDDLKLVVRICHKCHQKAHSLHFLRYVRYYCKILGYDNWLDAFRLVNKGEINETV